MAHAVTIDDIRAAARLLDGQVLRTPTLPAPGLSRLAGTQIIVKYETMQTTGAFKERGALGRLSELSEDERRRGVVAMLSLIHI